MAIGQILTEGPESPRAGGGHELPGDANHDGQPPNRAIGKEEQRERPGHEAAPGPVEVPRNARQEPGTWRDRTEFNRIA